MDGSKLYNDLLILSGICKSKKPLNYPPSLSETKKRNIRELLFIPSFDGHDAYEFIGDLLDEEKVDVGYLLGFLELVCAVVEDKRMRMDYCTLIMAKLRFRGLLDDH